MNEIFSEKAKIMVINFLETCEVNFFGNLATKNNFPRRMSESAYRHLFLQKALALCICLCMNLMR